MGCDIHEFYEVQDANGEWQLYDYREKYRKPNPENEYDEFDYPAMFEDPLDIGRNYRFFAFLADVRNGSGFAGCDTGDVIEPIDDPRGIPDDASDAACAEAYRYGGDGHSHSWFTGAELRDADWNQETVERCIIDFAQYPKFKEHGHADDIFNCSGVWGRNVVTLLPEQADALLAHPERMEAGMSYYVKVEYARSLREELAYYHDKWLSAVLSLHEDPDKIRFVFFFDN